MRFKLQEVFSKSMPDWLREKLVNTDRAVYILKHNLSGSFDYNKAKFDDIYLPTDLKGREQVISDYLNVADADVFNNQIVFMLVKGTQQGKQITTVFAPGFNDTHVLDEGTLRYIAATYPENVLAACYTYDYLKDYKKASEREKNRMFHNDSAFNKAGQRYDYDGHFLPDNRIILDDRTFDASGYLLKPAEYYQKKLLSYQREDYAKALKNVYDKLVKASDIIKSYITIDADFLDPETADQVRDILKSLNSANKRYNRTADIIDDCKTEAELDEVFEPYGEFDSLNKLTKHLLDSVKSIQYTDFNW